MNAQNTFEAPKVRRETKNKIRVDFERTSFWTRFRLRFLTGTAIKNALIWIFRMVFLLGVSYVILMPFYSKIASSFMSREDFVDVTVKLLPKHPTLDTYKAIIIEEKYFQALLNTTLLSGACALLQTMVCAMIGYGFAKYKFKGSKLLFALVVLTMIIPHNTMQFAMYMRFNFFDFGVGRYGILNLIMGKQIKLTNTYWPLIMLSASGLAFKNGLYIFMLRQFFRGVPDELEESAYIDGYGPFQTFVKIVLPISVPMLITVFLFAFSWQWTDNFYISTLFTTKTPKLLTYIIAVPRRLDTDYAGRELYTAAIRNTCGLLIIAPLLVVYLFFQRYLVEGIERSGIVG